MMQYPNGDTRPHAGNVLVYVLDDPREMWTYRYVGITWRSLRERLGEHCAASGSHGAKAEWIDSLWRAGVVPRIMVIDEAPIEEGKKRERWWIERLRERENPLLNAVVVGDRRRQRWWRWLAPWESMMRKAAVRSSFRPDCYNHQRHTNLRSGDAIRAWERGDGRAGRSVPAYV